MGENDDRNLAESNALLADILGVLKRIDAHMEAQEARIGALDARVTTLASTADTIENHNSGIRKECQGAVDGGTISLKKNSLPNNPTSKPRELRLWTSNRNGSLGSRDRQNSTASHQSLWTSSRSRNKKSGKSTPWRSTSQAIIPSPKTTTISRTGTWHSVPHPPTAAESENIAIEDDSAYNKFPPSPEWITTRSLGKALDVRYSSTEAKMLWTKYVGDSWTIPPDGRIEMTFQQHLLERLDKERVTHLLQTLSDVSNRLEYQSPSDFAKRGSFRVTDFGFDTNFEESAAEYRAEVLTGKYRKNPISSHSRRPSTIAGVHTAPWKRMIEVRGLSKRLIDEHETWTQNFRNPWTEALPMVSPILPFLTDRDKDRHEKKYTGMNAVHQALLHHQQCKRQTPQNDQNFSFHLTFYEVVDLTHDDELAGEIWRSGRLHSDNEKELESLLGVKSRRIRQSACTIVVVPDQNDEYWTSIYLCPNNFDLYDKIPSLIMKQNAEGVYVHMMEFTMRMVVERWSKVANYFAWLIGHRDALRDPDAHDSLLFDDDTFSRSRKYFWAINYLAELDISISENITYLAKLLEPRHTWFSQRGERFAVLEDLDQRLEQLRVLKAKLRAQREEAIALRDGLFSASGVIESRASTRLGENVKLLTFVSIFFLPLSFCMSIWSVNNTIFSLKALIIVVILVGLGTYLVVFNLNNMVNLSSRFYDKRKKNLVTQMKLDSDDRWREQGKRFEFFKPKQEIFKPSEWVLGLFILHKLIKLMSFRLLFTRNENKAVTEESEDDNFVEQGPEASHDTGKDSLDIGDPRKIKKMQIKETVPVKSSFSRWSRILRRDALSPTLEQQHV